MVDRSAMEAYLGRCLGLLMRLGDYLPADALDQSQHLIDHGEPAEGLLSAAWAASEGGVQLPDDVLAELRDLIDELVPEEFWPQSLKDLPPRS